MPSGSSGLQHHGNRKVVSVIAPQSKDIDMSIMAPGIDVGLATISVHCQTLDGFTVTLRGRQRDGVS